jgi:WD40 repeat protein
MSLIPLRPTDWLTHLGDPVAQISWSPDGAVILAGGVDGRVALFSAADGSLLRGFVAHGDGLFRAAFSPTENIFATSGQDGMAKLWNPLTGELLHTLSFGSAWVEQLAWAPAGGWLAVAAGRRLRLWQAATGVVHESTDHRSTVTALAWRADGQRVASACYAGAEVWAVATGQHVETLPWNTSLISLAWSPDSRWLVGGTQEQSVQIWELPFKPGNELAMSGYAAKVRELAWHHSGRYLATGGGEQVMVWDCAGKGPAGSTPRILEGHLGRVNALDYQCAGHLLASGAQDACVLLWNAGKSGNALRQFKLPAAVTEVRWSPDGKRVAIGCRDGSVALGAAPN